jgi:hypothetical protein
MRGSETWNIVQGQVTKVDGAVSSNCPWNKFQTRLLWCKERSRNVEITLLGNCKSSFLLSSSMRRDTIAIILASPYSHALSFLPITPTHPHEESNEFRKKNRYYLTLTFLLSFPHGSPAYLCFKGFWEEASLVRSSVRSLDSEWGGGPLGTPSQAGHILQSFSFLFCSKLPTDNFHSAAFSPRASAYRVYLETVNGWASPSLSRRIINA